MRLIDVDQLSPDSEWDESYGGFVSYSQFQIDTAPTVEVDHILGNDMIVLPCKVGDTVWKVEDVWCLDDKETWTYHYEKEVIEFMVRSISISCNSKGVWTKKIQNLPDEGREDDRSSTQCRICGFRQNSILQEG